MVPYKTILDCQSYDLQNHGLKIYNFSLEFKQFQNSACGVVLDYFNSCEAFMYLLFQDSVIPGIAPIQDYVSHGIAPMQNFCLFIRKLINLFREEKKYVCMQLTEAQSFIAYGDHVKLDYGIMNEWLSYPYYLVGPKLCEFESLNRNDETLSTIQCLDMIYFI